MIIKTAGCIQSGCIHAQSQSSKTFVPLENLLTMEYTFGTSLGASATTISIPTVSHPAGLEYLVDGSKCVCVPLALASLANIMLCHLPVLLFPFFF